MVRNLDYVVRERHASWPHLMSPPTC